MALVNPIKKDTVLIVDDTPENISLISSLLKGTYRIKVATDGKTAIDVSSSDDPPDLILLDIMMPDMDGYEVCAKLKNHPRTSDIPIIFLTAKAQIEDEQKGLELGAVDYITKPISPPIVLARVKTHLQLKRASDVLKEKNAALLASRQALAAELGQAADYVASLLPAPLADGAVSTAWRFFPSAQLGGDSFGYHWIDEDNFAMYLLDVCGHGVGSALLSVSAFNAIRAQTLPNTDFRIPQQVLTALNDAFPMEGNNNLFFSIWYGVFDRRTRELRFASGGHPPAFLVSKEGILNTFMTYNLFIGGLPDSVHHGDATTVSPGACLYVFSDGVYEVHPPEGAMWSLEKLGTYLLANRMVDGKDIDALYRKMQDYHGQDILEDDFSMMVIHFP